MVNLDWIDVLEVTILLDLSSMIFDLSDKICVSIKANVSKSLVEHNLCDFKCRSNGKIELKLKKEIKINVDVNVKNDLNNIYMKKMINGILQ